MLCEHLFFCFVLILYLCFVSWSCFILLCFCVYYSDVQRTLYCCFFFVFVLCNICCQFLWIVHLVLSLWYSLMFIYSYNHSDLRNRGSWFKCTKWYFYFVHYTLRTIDFIGVSFHVIAGSTSETYCQIIKDNCRFQGYKK